ncbi:helix-turn-helix domain-containing protein [Microbulbifer litoralis]|uniref:helix-turn-helix domain-containing protein n=1 Tax=Microbulbifer litoralis TaxID=2933965 RepID=UPI002027D4A0|nr:helix-turn-helix transcriptional regulator [Microbulbifer sp. GX H0434]
MRPGIVFDQVVGAVLAHYRTQAGLSQHQAVEGISIGVSSLSRLEKGDYSLTMEQLFELSQRYNVSMMQVAASIERTYANARKHGVHIEREKKSKSGLLLLGAAAIAAFVIASQ